MATETRERITDPERLSRLEGAHLHMATKADLAALETRLVEKMLESENRLIKWGVGIAVTAFAAAASLVAAGFVLLYRLLSS